MPTQTIPCAAKDCSCHVEQESAIELDGRLYCSNRCSEGRGCDHEGCNCGRFPTAEPEPNAPSRKP
jgi:hypothetical protein